MRYSAQIIWPQIIHLSHPPSFSFFTVYFLLYTSLFLRLKFSSFPQLSFLALLSVCPCFPILSLCLPFYLSATGNGFFPDPGGWNGILSQTKRSLCESSKIQRMKGRLIIIRKLLASTSFYTHTHNHILTYSISLTFKRHKMFLFLLFLHCMKQLSLIEYTARALQWSKTLSLLLTDASISTYLTHKKWRKQGESGLKSCMQKSKTAILKTGAVIRDLKLRHSWKAGSWTAASEIEDRCFSSLFPSPLCRSQYRWQRDADTSQLLPLSDEYLLPPSHLTLLFNVSFISPPPYLCFFSHVLLEMMDFPSFPLRGSLTYLCPPSLFLPSQLLSLSHFSVKSGLLSESGQKLWVRCGKVIWQQHSGIYSFNQTPKKCPNRQYSLPLHQLELQHVQIF